MLSRLNFRTLRRFLRPRSLLLCGAFLLTPSLLVAFTWTSQEPEKVGKDICLVCHEEFTPQFKAPHAAEECEGCHGAGSVHVEAASGTHLSFANKEPSWAIGQCLSCHEKDTALSSFAQTIHGENQISCDVCHLIHAPVKRAALLRLEPNEQCLDCHRAVGADFRKPYHHPVLEKAMDCTDCHNPHEGDRDSLLRTAVGTDPSCASCHPDKMGPFVFEHAPAEIDGCGTCHQPHGSTNPKMLVRSQVQQLCLECHTATSGVAGPTPFAFHDLRSSRFRNCTVCHREIHGSQVNSDFLR